MTEAEWLAATDPIPLLYSAWVESSKRKAWLFGCASCRRIWHLLIHPASRRAINVAERFVDGNAERPELESAAEGARLAYNLAYEEVEPFASALDPAPGSYFPAAHAALKLVYPARPVGWSFKHETVEAASAAAGRNSEASTQVELLHDIFGNPFRPVAVDPTWLTSDVLTLATSIYEDRAFDRMPILADALQDAGCENDDILKHCRQQGEHVRGCWVVDLLLGKS